MSTDQSKNGKTSSLDSSHPVFVPYRPELFYPADKLWTFVLSELTENEEKPDEDVSVPVLAETEGSWSKIDAQESEFDLVSRPDGDVAVKLVVPAESRDEVGEKEVDKHKKDNEDDHNSVVTVDPKNSDAFVRALLDSMPQKEHGTAPENITLTAKGMPAYTSTLTPTLDLFSDLQSAVSTATLNDLLTQSWHLDPLETLKIIFQCRSIHLGKGEKENFYKAIGWLASSAGRKGKATVLANLGWVVDRTIMKPKKKDETKEKGQPSSEKPAETEMAEENKGYEKPAEAEMAEENKGDEKPKEEDEEESENNAVFSHGYWKDLGNILALEVQDSLNIFSDVTKVLNVPRDTQPRRKQFVLKDDLSQEEITKKKNAVKAAVHKKEKDRHLNFLRKFDEKFYMLLHLFTARIFATQLHHDLDALKSGDRKRMNQITFAAKWAPSLEAYHDKHTFLASSIAEILFPPEHDLMADCSTDREDYLKHAREYYRRLYLSPLRAHLRIVERDVSAEKFDRINYNHVPSLAMNRYKKLFTKKDKTRFKEYLKNVALGKAKISGAVLTPASLVHRAISVGTEDDIEMQIIDGQWNSLVQSVRDRGTVESAIAIVDVSGSMSSPQFSDRTCPMDSAIGLGMLLAEIAEEPFKNLVITFSDTPQLVRLDDETIRSTSYYHISPADLTSKVTYMKSLPWGFTTNFLSVFEDLLLPVAVKHKLTQEQMVKRIFVFSDMQFDNARKAKGAGPWETGYERIKRKYNELGYEVPELVYWNLASSGAIGKPATAQMEGVTIMAGGGAGTMKAFLECLSGQEIEAEESEEEDKVMVGAEDEKNEGRKRQIDCEEEEGKKRKRKKKDPLTAMRTLLSNPAYAGLKVVE